MIYMGRYDSPLGPITLAGEDGALTGLWFDGQKYFGAGLPAGTPEGEPPVFRQVRAWLDRYFRGEDPGPAPPLAPAGTVYLFGAGHVGLALVHLLALTEFPVVVYDQRPAPPDGIPEAVRVVQGPYEDALSRLEAIGPEDYVVIMTPGHQGDYEVLRQVLRTPARYVGCIGSRRKIAATRERLLADGFSEADFARVHAPIGLDIGGETPQEIALSVAAQLVACRAGKPTRREDRP